MVNDASKVKKWFAQVHNTNSQPFALGVLHVSARLVLCCIYDVYIA